MRALPRVAFAIGLAAALATGGAAPAEADVDTDFANELHAYGIYGQRDYNAWRGKLVCQRLSVQVDPDAFASTRYLARNLDGSTTTAQTWRFLASAVSTYCPDQQAVLSSVATAQGH